MPHRPDRMYHISAWKIIRARGPGLACRTAAKRLALGKQSRPCRPVDGPVNTATAQKRCVRRIDYRIRGKLDYVAYLYFQHAGSVVQKPT